MKFYLITRKDETDYDETNAVVVRASDKRQAKSLALGTSDRYGWGPEPDYPGFRKDNLVITELAYEGKAEVVCVDFLQG